MTFLKMSLTEIKRYEIMERLIRSEINGTDAAALLKLSTRQIRRLKAQVIHEGPVGLVHGNRGRPSNRRIPDHERDRIGTLLRQHYADFKPTLASEKLAERHGISYDPKTIRTIMIQKHLWRPRKAKSGHEHRSWRQRRSHYGEMIQFDGSYHHWFEDRGPEACLLLAVDDASGALVGGEFVSHEGVEPVFHFWQRYVENEGKPWSIYTDNFSTYKMNPRFVQNHDELKTQFGRAMSELEIELIFAHSPQAKGRVERVFKTLQDRLIKEMRLAEITSREDGNRFLAEVFIPQYNAYFAVKPASPANLHRKLSREEKKKLDSIFSRQYHRKVQNDFTICYKKGWYQLLKDQTVTVCKRDEIVVEERLNGAVWLRYRGKYLNYKILPHRPFKGVEQPWVLAATAVGVKQRRKPYKPSVDHPWRKFHFSPKPSILTVSHPV